MTSMSSTLSFVFSFDAFEFFFHSLQTAAYINSWCLPWQMSLLVAFAFSCTLQALVLFFTFLCFELTDSIFLQSIAGADCFGMLPFPLIIVWLIYCSCFSSRRLSGTILECESGHFFSPYVSSIVSNVFHEMQSSLASCLNDAALGGYVMRCKSSLISFSVSPKLRECKYALPTPSWNVKVLW